MLHCTASLLMTLTEPGVHSCYVAYISYIYGQIAILAGKYCLLSKLKVIKLTITSEKQVLPTQERNKSYRHMC